MITTYTTEQIKIANKTCRDAGFVGRNAITPKFVKNHLQKLHNETNKPDNIYSVLDFGAGKNAIHAKELTKENFLYVEAWEFGENKNDNHIKHLEKTYYDFVYSSNVLNVQSHSAMLSNTLTMIYFTLAKGGSFFANYPLNPRKMKAWKNADMMNEISSIFGNCEFKDRIFRAEKR